MSETFTSQITQTFDNAESRHSCNVWKIPGNECFIVKEQPCYDSIPAILEVWTRGKSIFPQLLIRIQSVLLTDRYCTLKKTITSGSISGVWVKVEHKLV